MEAKYQTYIHNLSLIIWSFKDFDFMKKKNTLIILGANVITERSGVDQTGKI